MFLEPHFRGQRSGWMEVICGCMFSGKTEELIRRLKRAEIAGQKVQIFKPERDHRYEEEQLISHDENALIAQPVEYAADLMYPIEEETDVIGIDEAQFFDDELPSICEQLLLDGKRVVLAGLDMDYRGNPFGPMPHLLANAEYITKVHAICKHCGSLANYSYRLVPSDKQVLLGEEDKYEARCRTCFNMGNIIDFNGESDDSISPGDPAEDHD